MRIHLATRAQSYLALLGFVVGMLVAGLVVPLGFGSRRGETVGSVASVGESRAGFSEASPDEFGVVDGTMGEARKTLSGPGRASPRGVASIGAADRPAARSGAKLTATDRGVTSDSITIGILIAEPAGAGQFGIDPAEFDPAVEERAWKAFIAHLNARGGILGRNVKPIFRRYDPVAEGSSRAACLYLTQDKQVFAVFNYGAGYDDVLCVTKENQTLFLKGDPEAEEDIFHASGGYFSSTLAHSHRQNRNLAWELHRKGVLKGKKIGVVANEMWRSSSQALIATLRALGYRIDHVTWFSQDFNTAQSQAPGEVLQHKDKGIQVEFLVSHFVDHNGFVQHAEAQQFFPVYAVNDIAGNTEDIATTGMPRSFESVIGITFIRSGEWRTGLPEAPQDRACRQIYERGTGEELARSDENTRYVVMLDCDMMQRFEAAAIATGAELTRKRFVTAIQGLGERALPYTGGGSYRMGKFDGADFVRTKRWAFDCKCWRVTEDFRRGRY